MLKTIFFLNLFKNINQNMKKLKYLGYSASIAIMILSCKKKERLVHPDSLESLKIVSMQMDSLSFDVSKTEGVLKDPFSIVANYLNPKFLCTFIDGTSQQVDLEKQEELYRFKINKMNVDYHYYLKFTSSNNNLNSLLNAEQQVVLNPEFENCLLCPTILHQANQFDVKQISYTLFYSDIEKKADLIPIAGTEKNLYSFDVIPDAGESYKKTYTIKYINENVFIKEIYYKDNSIKNTGSGLASNPFVIVSEQELDKNSLIFDTKSTKQIKATLHDTSDEFVYSFQVEAGINAETYFVAYKSSNTSLNDLKYINTEGLSTAIFEMGKIKTILDKQVPQKILYRLNNTTQYQQADLALQNAKTNTYAFEVIANAGNTQKYTVDFLSTDNSITVLYNKENISLKTQNIYQIFGSSCFDIKQLTLINNLYNTEIANDLLSILKVGEEYVIKITPPAGEQYAKEYTIKYAVKMTSDGNIVIQDANSLLSIGQCALFPLSGSYTQLADIDLSTIKMFTPIVNFTGKYDGNSYKIISMNVQSDVNTGLFASTAGATLSKIALENVNINGINQNTGALVGYASQTKISNC